MKTANPAPLGLFGFALTTFLLSMINAGFIPGTGLGVVLAMAFAFGGFAQFCAGLMEMTVGNTFGFVAFCSYGAFWLSFALFVEFFAKDVPGVMVGWYLAAWGAFTFVMFIGTFALNRALQAIFFVLTITFALLALKDLTGNAALGGYGGDLGIVTAFLAFYLGAAHVINGTHGRVILPIGG
ncbi:MAG: transcriptional regulator [Rhodospirillales bacterium 20-60-12]|jgi:succinate-acetate transporter protein|nr:MAG: transcriptional regulator [Rhodospirillales bacterium 20-60-12]